MPSKQSSPNIVQISLYGLSTGIGYITAKFLVCHYKTILYPQNNTNTTIAYDTVNSTESQDTTFATNTSRFHDNNSTTKSTIQSKNKTIHTILYYSKRMIVQGIRYRHEYLPFLFLFYNKSSRKYEIRSISSSSSSSSSSNTIPSQSRGQQSIISNHYFPTNVIIPTLILLLLWDTFSDDHSNDTTTSSSNNDNKHSHEKDESNHELNTNTNEQHTSIQNKINENVPPIHIASTNQNLHQTDEGQKVHPTTIISNYIPTSNGHPPLGNSISSSAFCQDYSDSKRSRSNSILTQTSVESSSSTAIQPEISTSASSPNTSTRYLEILVHNVSHTDLVLCLGIPQKLFQQEQQQQQQQQQHRELNMKAHDEDKHVLCRPRFSAFDILSRKILDILQSYHPSTVDSTPTTNTTHTPPRTNSSNTFITKPSSYHELNTLFPFIMSFPRYERLDSDPRFPLVTPRPSRQSLLPVGINIFQLAQDVKERTKNDSLLNKLAIRDYDLQSLRIRGKDLHKIEPLINGQLSIPKLVHSKSLDSEGRDLHNSLNESKDSTKTNEGIQNISLCNNLSSDKGLHLECVFFPLLSSLMRRWYAILVDKYGLPSKKKSIKKVIVLVSGVGTPRNWTHSITGNSTEACAQLMEIFIKILYPEVTVVRVHSEREIFRYDENITFAKCELMPVLDAYRDAHARGEKYPDEIYDQNWTSPELIKNITPVHDGKSFDPDWKQTFSVTLSFADGAPARTHAIQASLKPFRPTYFHFWQLKTFWHDSKICDDDIEVHSFEDMETVPAMEIDQTSSDVQMVVGEMKKFREFFLETIQNDKNDIRKFWLRKTKKPVLAVLLVRHPEKGLITYRGTNMEVSMPTGSLCAERNVIGTALAANPAIRREDLIMVAVLAVPLPNLDIHIPSPSHNTASLLEDQLICQPAKVGSRDTPSSSTHGAGSDFLLLEVQEKLKTFQRRENIRRSLSVGSFASIPLCEEEEEEETQRNENLEAKGDVNSSQYDTPTTTRDAKQSDTTISSSTLNIPLLDFRNIHSDSFPAINSEDVANQDAETPVRRISLYKAEVTNENKQKLKRTKRRTVLVHSLEDINPLKPCGACNEWLKKIAESNPSFKVLTFTDAGCKGVYVTPCQD